MIVKDEFLNKLRRYFSLNLYEVKIWTALLSRGVSTAGELSDIANVPRSRSYDVLESLEKKGFIITKLGKPIKYIAVPPEDVIERVKKKIKEEQEQKTKVIEGLNKSEILTELNLLHSQGIELVEPTDLSGALKGRGNLYNHFETMIKSAEKTVDIMTTEEGLIRKAEVLKNVLQKAKERKVRIRIVAPVNKNTKKAVEELKGIAEIKNTEDVNARICLIDGKQIMFMLLDDSQVHPSYDSGVWVNTPFFASALRQMFENEWKTVKAVKN